MLLWFAVKVIISTINLMLNHLKRSSCFSRDLTHAFTFLSVHFWGKASSEILLLKNNNASVFLLGMAKASRIYWKGKVSKNPDSWHLDIYIVYKALTKTFRPWQKISWKVASVTHHSDISRSTASRLIHIWSNQSIIIWAKNESSRTPRLKWIFIDCDSPMLRYFSGLGWLVWLFGESVLCKILASCQAILLSFQLQLYCETQQLKSATIKNNVIITFSELIVRAIIRLMLNRYF